MRGDVDKLVAALVGAGVCLAVLAAWRLPTSGSPPGLDLRLIAVPPGELTVQPTGVVASARAMQAGDPPAQGSVDLENIVGRRLVVQPLALPSAKGLARQVHLRFASGGRTVAAGTLAALERPGGEAMQLAAGSDAEVEMSAWLPPGSSGYRGQILDVTVEFRSKPLGAGT